MKPNFFVKSHGLGNEYIVLAEENINFELTSAAIKRLCDTNYGLGTDGVLLKIKSDKAAIGLRIFNPDGSEAEKSGNGLRIFCKYIFDYKIIEKETFTVETLGGIVKAQIKEIQNQKAKIIRVDMGKAIFEADRIPTNFKTKEVIDQEIHVNDETYIVSCVSVGNPHCVVVKEHLDKDEIKRVGAAIENHSLFPNRINVQFVKVINRNCAEILIWERGAGFTLASGSSSSAVAAILKRKNLIDQHAQIRMLGGTLELDVDDDWNIKMTGEVRQICEGELSPELIEDF